MAGEIGAENVMYIERRKKETEDALSEKSVES